MQANKKRKKKKVWPWILISVVVLLVSSTVFLNPMRGLPTTAFQSYTVSRGNVEATITGSGTLQAEDVEDIELPDSVLVSKVLVKAGDTIQKGDVLADLDYESLAERAAFLSDELSALDKNISSRKTSQYIYSPVDGRVKQIFVSEGSDVVDTISEQSGLALISTDGLMKLEITTNQELELEAEVEVKWSDDTETGKIARKTASGYIVTLTDKETPFQETAQVYDGDTLIGEGTIEINEPIAVYGNSGTIKKVHYSEDEYTYAGNTLFTLEDAVSTNSYRLALVERNEKEEQLQTVLQYMTNPQLVAATDGLISEVFITENTKTGSSTDVSSNPGFSAAFSIHTGGAVKMFINVDELDISSVVLGQEVTVTLDAFAGEEYEAKVAHISKLSTATGNIATYPVELSLEYNEHFCEGMNGSAVIITERAENVLFIPIAAIYEDSTGTYVYTINGETQTRVDITTGISDGINAEVTSGLSENDVIQYVDTSSSDGDVMVGFRGMGGGERS